jgi:hypothetical protein
VVLKAILLSIGRSSHDTDEEIVSSTVGSDVAEVVQRWNVMKAGKV